MLSLPSTWAQNPMHFEVELLEWTNLPNRGDFAARWDELFSRSSAQLPSSRFDHLRLWMETFAPGARGWALVAMLDGRWMAALPLRQTTIGGCLPAWEIPYSYWTPSPEILVDREFGADPALAIALRRALRKTGRGLFRGNELHQGQPASELLQQIWIESGWPSDWNTRYEIGEVLIRGSGAPANWEGFQMALSGNFRRQMRKMIRRADSLGGVELRVDRPVEPEAIQRLLQEGFEIEDRGWKGAQGSSVLKSPGLFEFYQRQANLLAGQGELLILRLQHQNQTIAFEYGWKFQHTYFSPKIAYEESAAHLSPGHLLMHLWMEQMFAGDEFERFNFCGPLSEATARWQPRTYPVRRLIAATNRLGGLALRTGLQLARLRRQWAQRSKPATPVSQPLVPVAEVPVS